MTQNEQGSSYPPSPNTPICLPQSPASPASPSVELKVKAKGTPQAIPWTHFLPLWALRTTDAMAYYLIFPFITEYITTLDVNPARIGLYAGMAEGCLMLVEAALATSWAKLADRYGRKRCLVWGFGVFVCSTAMVGFGKSVGWILFWRAIYGMNPSGVVQKLALAEITHPSNRTKMIAIFSPIFSVGGIVGSLVGGELARPFGQLPLWLGGGVELFKTYPYALPGILTTICGVASIIFFQLFMPDTPTPSNGASSGGVDKAEDKQTIAAVLKVPNFKALIGIGLAFQLAVFGLQGMFTVFSYMPVSKGGLGLPVDLISLTIVMQAIFTIVCTPIMVPILEARLGTRGAIFASFALYPIQALLVPFAQYVAVGTENENGSGTWIWLVIGLQMLLRTFGSFAWPLCDGLLFVLFDDFPQLLATASALQLIAGAAGRALGPPIAGWIYSISTQYDVGTLGRQISWLGLLLMSVPPIFFTMQLPKDRVRNRGKTGYERLPTIEEGSESEEEEESVHPS